MMKGSGENTLISRPFVIDAIREFVSYISTFLHLLVSELAKVERSEAKLKIDAKPNTNHIPSRRRRRVGERKKMTTTTTMSMAATGTVLTRYGVNPIQSMAAKM